MSDGLSLNDRLTYNERISHNDRVFFQDYHGSISATMTPHSQKGTMPTTEAFSRDEETYKASLETRAKDYFARNPNSRWSAHQIASRIYEIGKWEDAHARAEGPDDLEAIIRILRWIDNGSGATSEHLQHPFADTLDCVDVEYAAEPPMRGDRVFYEPRRIDRIHNLSQWETNLKGPSPAQQYPLNHKISKEVEVARRGSSNGLPTLPHQPPMFKKHKDPRKVNWRVGPSDSQSPPHHSSTDNNVQYLTRADRRGPFNGCHLTTQRSTKETRKDPRKTDRRAPVNHCESLKNVDWRDLSQDLSETRKVERILKRGEMIEGEKSVNQKMETSPEGVNEAKPVLKKSHSFDIEIKVAPHPSEDSAAIPSGKTFTNDLSRGSKNPPRGPKRGRK